MKYCFLLLLTVKTIYGFGLFPPNMPFHMQFDIPAFPSMSAMPFPAIFNPMEVMPRGTEEPEARGMEIDGPMGNITTKNKTEVKDGFKVTTITSNGPGFHSYIKEYQKEGNATGNETGFDMSKMMGGGNLFKIMQQLRNAERPKKKKCKKCGSGKFCDPIFQLCRKKFAEGRTCMFQKQCGKNLRCQWGKCQIAKAGDPGTFCKGNSQCNGDACCRNTPGAIHLMCIPRQAEGAICGLKKEAFADVLYIYKRSTAPTCSPCENGLKCADSGDREFKQCVKKTYVERAADEMEDDNPSNALDDDDNDDDDDESGSGKESDPLKGIPPKGKPNTSSKNPIKDEADNKWEPSPMNTDDKEDEDDKDDDDDEDEKDNEDENGLGDSGIAVQKPPKKEKGKEKQDKNKTKGKSD